MYYFCYGLLAVVLRLQCSMSLWHTTAIQYVLKSCLYEGCLSVSWHVTQSANSVDLMPSCNHPYSDCVGCVYSTWCLGDLQNGSSPPVCLQGALPWKKCFQSRLWSYKNRECFPAGGMCLVLFTKHRSIMKNTGKQGNIQYNHSSHSEGNIRHWQSSLLHCGLASAPENCTAACNTGTL